MRLLRLAATAIALTSLIEPSLSAQQTPGALAGIDSYVGKVMAAQGIVGLSVAVVRNDAVIYAAGFGLKHVGRPERVTPRTVFAIGSNTKLFTAVLAGILVDEGRMAWNDPITKYLAGFQLYDPWVTREITLTDALSHRSGLGQRGEMVAYGSSLDRAEVLSRLRQLRPNTSFRSEFGYSNAMFLAAGEAVAAAAGESWDKLVEHRIFAPLGMTSSTTSIADLDESVDVASPHTLHEGGIISIPWRNIDNIGPAGSINSNVLDMAQWLRFLLNNGQWNGRQLLSRASLQQIQSPRTIMPFASDSLRPSMHFLMYGFGVMMHDYMGLKVLTHTGGIDGMLSDVTWVPERRVGIVVLTNTDGKNTLFSGLSRWILDRYLGAPEQDWASVMASPLIAMDRELLATRARVDSARPRNSKPSLSNAAYAGRYQNDLYGIIRVTDDQGLVLSFDRGLSARLTHWGNNTFSLSWTSLGPALLPAYVTFELDPSGLVEALTIRDDVLAPPGLRIWENDRFARLPTANR